MLRSENYEFQYEFLAFFALQTLRQSLEYSLVIAATVCWFVVLPLILGCIT